MDDAADGFAKRLKALRVAQQPKLSQPRLSAIIGADPGSVSRWERNVGLPNAEHVIALANHFQVSTDHLLLGKPLEPRVKSPEFHKFLATPYGHIAQERGWVPALLTMDYPYPPTVKIYKGIVNVFLMEEADAEGEPAPSPPPLPVPRRAH